MREFDGKVALVTGGASGIGAAIAARLRELGAAVAVLDRDVSAVTEGIAVTADVTDDAAVRTAVGTAVEAGSMGKAAERLHTSQPAVSRAISDLEHALGVPLLDRSPQGIQPTQYGRAIIKRGLAVFDELRQGPSRERHQSAARLSRALR